MALFRYIQRPIFSAWRRPAAIVVPPRDYRYPLRVPRATRTFHVQLAGPQDVEDVGRIDSSRRSKDAPRYYPLPIGPDPRPVFEYLYINRIFRREGEDRDRFDETGRPVANAVSARDRFEF